MDQSRLQALIEAIDRELQRIASWARREFALDEVRSEAWLIAIGMEREALTPPDWRDPLLRAELIRRVRIWCAYSQRRHRNAVSLDAARRIGDGTDFPALIESVPAPESSDPLIELLQEEEAATQPRRPELQWHYSQGLAYAHLRQRLGMRQLALFLRISISHCYRRYERAATPDREHQRMLAIGAMGRSANEALRPWRRYKILRKPWQLRLDFDGEFFRT